MIHSGHGGAFVSQVLVRCCGVDKYQSLPLDKLEKTGSGVSLPLFGLDMSLSVLALMSRLHVYERFRQMSPNVRAGVRELAGLVPDEVAVDVMARQAGAKSSLRTRSSFQLPPQVETPHMTVDRQVRMCRCVGRACVGVHRRERTSRIARAMASERTQNGI